MTPESPHISPAAHGPSPLWAPLYQVRTPTAGRGYQTPRHFIPHYIRAIPMRKVVYLFNCHSSVLRSFALPSSSVSHSSTAQLPLQVLHHHIRMLSTLKHAKLGKINGVAVDGTVQFRGLKYASLKNRFAPPQLVTSYETESTDATRYGSVF
jgi:hypothetical protein